MLSLFSAVRALYTRAGDSILAAQAWVWTR